MKDDFEDIDKLFREALDQNNEVPSGKVWNNVEVSLDRKSVVELSKKYNNLKKLVAVLLLLLVVSISYEVYHLNQSHQSLKDSKEETPVGIAPKDNTGGSPSGNVNSVQSPGKASASEPAHINSIPSTNDAAIVIKRARTKQSIFLKSSRPSRQRVYKVGNTTPIVADNINGTESLSNTRNSTTALENKIERGVSSLIGNNQQGVYSYTPADFSLSSPEIKPGRVSLVDAHKITPVLLENKTSSKTATASKLSKGSHLLQRVSINPFYAPDIDLYHVKRGDHPGDRDDFEKDEDRKYSYTTGFNIDVSLNKHLSLRSGLAYSSTSLHVSSRDIYAMKDSNGDTTFRFDGTCGSGNFHPPHGTGQPSNIGDSLQVTDANNSLGYLRLPLEVQYSLVKGRFVFNALAGAAINFLVKSSLTATVASTTAKELQTVSSVDGLKKTTYTALMGLGAEYVLNKRINLTFSPLATLALTPINTSASAVHTYPNTLSFAAGIKIKL